ncbi:MAG: WecB/TagA/CpsF family glycosyltransferase, partial [Endomicrobiia bacterium]|nr:WecB/TagA/CpsF family glycosyltransferase [Endomicrobiia bacterium]
MRFLIGDFGVESLDSGEVLGLIRALPPSATPLHIVTFNSLMYLDALASRDFAAVLDSADLLLAESSGIKWAAKFLYDIDITSLAGIDLVTSWFEASSRASSRFPTTFYFFGGQPGVARDTAVAVTKRFPNVRIAGWRDGFFDEKDTEAIARE